MRFSMAGVCLIALVVLGAVGCGSTGMSVVPKSTFIQDRSEAVPVGAQGEDAGLKVTVETVIAPNGPASWVKDADWDEYVLTLENRAADRLVIESWHLIDPRGVYVGSERTMQALEQRADVLEAEYETYGMAYTKHLGRRGVVLAAVAGPGLLGTGLMGATAAAAAPLAAVAIPAYVYWHYHTNQRDTERITAEFAGRLAPDPLLLAPGAKMSASIFFPPVPSPNAVVVGYRHGDSENSLEVSLSEHLDGLHEADPEP